MSFSTLLNHFKLGEFVVNLSGKAFSSVAFDELHEMVINKDIEAAIRRIEPDYIQRICPYLPMQANVIQTIKSQMNFSRASAVNPNFMHLSKQDVNFQSNVRAIYNIVKDQVATLQVREDMLSFVSIGERKMDAFVNSRILNIPSTEAPVS